MELSIIKGPRLVIALDIGSSYSGYAWQERSEFETNRSLIHYNTQWGGGLQLHKTTTCILIECPINEEGTVDEGSVASQAGEQRSSITDVKTWIGHQAENKYVNLAKKTKQPGELAGHFFMFKQFKHYLYRKGFTKEQLAEDQISQTLPLFQVMSLFIKGLKDNCLQKLQNKGIAFELSQTLFIVTVPAIWSDEAKKFMRNAAEEEGIGKRNVLLALEPEAAAIHCIHLPEEQKENMNKLGMKGQKFLVADLGGGTADLSAELVEDNGQLSEILPPLGDYVGGQKINEAFFQVCHDCFEGDEWKKVFSKATPVEMFQMESDFEMKKVQIASEDEDVEMISLDVPKLIKEKLQDGTIKLKPAEKFKFEDGEFLFSSAFVRESLFRETCNLVYKILQRVLTAKEAESLNTVVLVGGFSESPIVVNLLREKITKDYPNIKVVVPPSPFKAVLNGAVLFGHDPLIFMSRISRATYGVETNSIFDPEVHDEAKKWLNKENNKYYCKSIFDLHVRKGQSVKLNREQPKKSYWPLYKDQTEVSIPVYTSASMNPKYTTDEGCKQIANINVKMPDTEKGTDREVEVTMTYGGTELSVSAVNKKTGEKYTVDIQFSHT